jgi:hypothetical protein
VQGNVDTSVEAKAVVKTSYYLPASDVELRINHLIVTVDLLGNSENSPLTATPFTVTVSGCFAICLHFSLAF